MAAAVAVAAAAERAREIRKTLESLRGLVDVKNWRIC